MTPRPLRLAAMAAIALLIAACGGTASTTAPTGAPTAPPAATGTPAATDAPTDAPTEAPTEAATEGATPDLDAIADFAGRLAELDAYTISMSVDGAAGKTTIAATTVTSPEEASRYDVSTPDGKSVSIVQIGADAWISQDGTTFIAVPSGTVETMLASLRPELLLGAFRVDRMADDLIATGTETKNGVQATHYHIDDQTPVPPGGSTVPPGMVADFWISDDGLLVAFEAAGIGSQTGGQYDTLDIQITNIDDPDLKVERPD